MPLVGSELHPDVHSFRIVPLFSSICLLGCLVWVMFVLCLLCVLPCLPVLSLTWCLCRLYFPCCFCLAVWLDFVYPVLFALFVVFACLLIFCCHHLFMIAVCVFLFLGERHPTANWRNTFREFNTIQVAETTAVEPSWLIRHAKIPDVCLRSTPHPVTVTTRIIPFLVGNPYKPSFVTVTGWGVDPRYACVFYLFVRWMKVNCVHGLCICSFHPVT